MRRWLFSFAAVVSLVLCVASAVLLLLSLWRTISFRIPIHDERSIQFASAKGRFCVASVETRGEHKSELPIALDELKSQTGPSPHHGRRESAMHPDTRALEDLGIVATTASFWCYDYVPWLIVTMPLPIYWSISTHQRRLRLLRTQRCPECGYDLRATPDRCPECGVVPQKQR